MTEFGEWVLRINWIVNIGVAMFIPVAVYFLIRERAREAARAPETGPGRSLLRRERPGPKRRVPAGR